MHVPNLSARIVKILAGEGASPLPAHFIASLKLGRIVQGTILNVLGQGRAEVAFEGQKTLVEFNHPVQIGQTLHARVEREAPNVILKPVAPPLPEARSRTGASLPPAGSPQHPEPDFVSRISTPPDARLPKLTGRTLDPSFSSRGDQTFLATVRRPLNSRSVAVELAGKEFKLPLAGKPMPEPGSRVAVRVDSSTGRVIVDLPETASPPVPVLRDSLRPYRPFRPLLGEMVVQLHERLTQPSTLKEVPLEPRTLARMREALEPLLPGKEKVPDAGQLRRQVEISGLNYESRLKHVLGKNRVPGGQRWDPPLDLKGRLLEFVRALEQIQQKENLSPAQGRTLQELMNVFRQGVDTLESNQLTHFLARQENQPLVIQLPNPFGGGESTLKLYVRNSSEEGPGKKGSQKEGYTLVFFLTLTALGRLQLESRVSGKRLFLKIQVESPEVAQFIQDRGQEFETRMRDLGFHVDLACCAKKVELPPEEAPEAKAFDPSSRWVDIKT